MPDPDFRYLHTADYKNLNPKVNHQSSMRTKTTMLNCHGTRIMKKKTKILFPYSRT